MKYSTKEVEEIGRKLRELPLNVNSRIHSKQETVQMLLGEFAELKQRGYTIDNIAEALTSSGLQITTVTLQNYLHRARRKSEKRSGSKRDAAAATSRGRLSKRPEEHRRQHSQEQHGELETNLAAAFTPTPDSEEI